MSIRLSRFESFYTQILLALDHKFSLLAKANKKETKNNITGGIMFDECKKENKKCKDCKYTCNFILDLNGDVLFAYMWGPLFITANNRPKEVKD